jgi:hypothetical protein
MGWVVEQQPSEDKKRALDAWLAPTAPSGGIAIPTNRRRIRLRCLNVLETRIVTYVTIVKSHVGTILNQFVN